MTTQTTLTAEQEAVLHGTSDEGLLATYAALTHKVHAVLSTYAPVPSGCTPGEVVSLRTQRDVVKAEILRRMAGGA